MPGPGEVLLRVQAAGITFTELVWDATWFRDGQPRTPVIPAHEVAGRVVESGPQVDTVRVGDPVFGLIPFDRDGASAEYAVVPQENVALRPLEVDPIHAAALPLAALTALQALVDHGGILEGQRVLVQGAAGAVGIFAVQLARLRGAHVTAVAREQDREYLQLMGAEHVIDYTSTPVTADGDGYDLALYAANGAPTEATYAAVRTGGVLVCLNAPPDGELLNRYGIRGQFFVVEANRGQMDELANLAKTQQLSIPIAATFPLAEGRAAYESGARHGRLPGKTVLVVETAGTWLASS
ncbi:NADP-dependent oxidoreductase [Planctomonas sp. JC2975]|uniref:NADP-dependent oxidoreductase n=1 Tax=Planctomonas sp. JC2975 TaxID=2729626 RepID=UPI0014756F5D|nr:NADP-dependent oxidoreductase [Planctomonas sp. JC2975]NNC10888.1 NADP-dependent oxidoreductase [Planctomonas sp. JC2975]